MSKDNSHYPWWGFWRLACIPAIIHLQFLTISILIKAILVFIHSINFEFMAYTGPKPSIQKEYLSTMDATAIYISSFNTSWPFMLGITLLASIGFFMACYDKRCNYVLIAYVAFQLLAGAFVSACYIYLISRGDFVVSAAPSDSSDIKSVWTWYDFYNWIKLYSIASIPMYLLVLRGIWVLIIKINSDVDSIGGTKISQPAI